MTRTKSEQLMELLPLYLTFVSECKNGIRLQKNGYRLKPGTIYNYLNTYRLLQEFSITKNFDLRINTSTQLNKNLLLKERRYWRKFYKQFTDFLYKDKGHFDNYVGSTIKNFRVFFRYLASDKMINTWEFYKLFYAPKEQIPVVTLSPEQLNFLIYDTEFESSLVPHLREIKDFFVFGCTVALRVSDLVKLTGSNLIQMNGGWYLQVRSKKTSTDTWVKLPDYAIEIVRKYKRKYKTLLPVRSLANLNKGIKQIAEEAGWTDPLPRVRKKRGVTAKPSKSSKPINKFRFCDHLSSHTMRKTAITTMLCLGMSETLVRNISGHAQGSKEFYRYVAISQAYHDNEIEKMHAKLKIKVLELR